MITPATAGPMTPAMDVDKLLRALACSNLASETTWGTSPVNAGLKKAEPAPTTAARTMKPHSGGLDTRIHTPRPSCARVRPTSEASMTIRRLKRSARTPPTRIKMTTGASPAADTKPTSLALPWRNTAKAMATGAMPVPICDADCPTKNRKKFRSLRAPTHSFILTGQA